MTLQEKIRWYIKHYGWAGLLGKGLVVATGGRLGQSLSRRGRQLPVLSVPVGPAERGPADAETLLQARFFRQQPLPVFPLQKSSPQVVLVTDSVSRGSLFGGVATAILLAGHVARAKGWNLQVVCRQEMPDAASIAMILTLNGIELGNRLTASFVDSRSARSEIGLGNSDIVITTSWWTTESVVAAIGPDRVFYLLQEDERMFYPMDDDHRRASALLDRPDIRLIINSELLYRHLEVTGLPALADRATWFEPAFVHKRREIQPFEPAKRRRLFFYARPGHPRNLYYLGLEVLQTAARRGVLDLDRWEVHFFGSDLSATSVAGKAVICHDSLNWQAYVERLATADAALSLMYTPHPSYPPLDLAALGVPVLTNRFGTKQTLENYSSSIVCADCDVESLVAGLARVIEMAGDRPARAAALLESRIESDWSKALAPAVERIVGSDR